jgi:predicted RNase H-like HicB family nuclease
MLFTLLTLLNRCLNFFLYVDNLGTLFIYKININLVMKYMIILEKEKEGGYSAQCLELPGAISQGESKEEAIENIKIAIELVLETLNQEVRRLGETVEISKVELSV